MNIEIKNETDNKLLNRRELLVRVDYEGKQTTSKAELEAAIANTKKVDFMKVQVSKIFSDNGRTAGTAWIRIYDEPVVEKIEAQKKVDAEKAKKEAEAKPEEKKEEAPAEKKEAKSDVPGEKATEKPATSDTDKKE